MTTNIEEYLRKMAVNQKLAIEASEKVINATLMQMYKKIIDRTPVGNPALWNPPVWPKGYTPGQLKASWSLSFNNVQYSTNGKFASGDQIVAGHGISLSVTNSSTNKTAAISNNQPYAERIEYGSWSTQAPAGMMRVTVAEYTSLIDSNAAKYRIR